jgi:hypothetical protein
MGYSLRHYRERDTRFKTEWREIAQTQCAALLFGEIACDGQTEAGAAGVA